MLGTWVSLRYIWVISHLLTLPLTLPLSINPKNASGFPPRPPLPDASHRSVQFCGRICCRGLPLHFLFVPPNHVFPYPGRFVPWGLLTWPILLTAPILHLLLQVLLLLFQFPTEWRRQPEFKMQLVLQKHSHPFFWDVCKVFGFSGIALKTVWRAGVPCGHSALSRCHLPHILWVSEGERERERAPQTEPERKQLGLWFQFHYRLGWCFTIMPPDYQWLLGAAKNIMIHRF